MQELQLGIYVIRLSANFYGWKKSWQGWGGTTQSYFIFLWVCLHQFGHLKILADFVGNKSGQKVWVDQRFASHVDLPTFISPYEPSDSGNLKNISDASVLLDALATILQEGSQEAGMATLQGQLLLF